MEYDIIIEADVRATFTLSLSVDDFKTAYETNVELSTDDENLAELMYDDLRDVLVNQVDGEVEDFNDDDLDCLWEEIHKYIEERRDGSEPDYANAPGQMHLEFGD